MKTDAKTLDAERTAIREAVERIEGNAPSDPKLSGRARRGSLRINLTTVATESGVKRHRIAVHHPELAATIIAAAGQRGTSEPLRKQLDAARKEKAEAELRLDRSRTYSYRLLERLTKAGEEIQRLKERIELLEEGPSGSEDLIGTPAIVGIPAVPSAKRRRQTGSQAA